MDRSTRYSLFAIRLFNDAGDDARTHGAAAFADRETQLFFHRDRHDQVHFHRDVVAGLALIEQLAEHLDARDNGLLGSAKTDDLDFLADLDDAAFDTARDNRAAARDREHVFYRHQERLIDRTLRLRNVAVDILHQLQDRVVTELLVLVFQGRQRRALDDRDLVAGEIVLRQEFANFQFNE